VAAHFPILLRFLRASPFRAVANFLLLCNLQFASVPANRLLASGSAIQLHIYSPMAVDFKAPAALARSPETPAVPEKRTSWIPLVIGLGILTVLSSGGVAWLVGQRGRADQPVGAAEKPGAAKFVVHLEGFTVNLFDPEETHFLRVTMDLGLERLPEGMAQEKISASLPVARIRDSILKVLTVCKADDLLTASGKTQLKKNLLESLNRDLPEWGVREVYFTEFLVQR
jgi:flagellar FliL protein